VPRHFLSPLFRESVSFDAGQGLGERTQEVYRRSARLTHAFTEEWIPPTPQQLEALAALTEKLQERYRVEAEELWRELQR
jgi:hypothetical protein